MEDPVGDVSVAPGQVSQHPPSLSGQPPTLLGMRRRPMQRLLILAITAFLLIFGYCQIKNALNPSSGFYGAESGFMPQPSSQALLEPLHQSSLCRAQDPPLPDPSSRAAADKKASPSMFGAERADLLGGCAPLLDANAQPLPVMQLLATGQALTSAPEAPSVTGSSLISEGFPLLRFRLVTGVQPGASVACGGIPLPRRLEIHRTERLAARLEDGAWLPLQVTPLSRWGGVPVDQWDAPLHWIRVCVQPPPASHGGGARSGTEHVSAFSTVALYRTGPQPRPRDPLAWTVANKNEYSLANGHWQILLSPGDTLPIQLHSLTLPGIALAPVGSSPDTTVRWRPESLRLVQSGPLEALLRLTGSTPVTPEALQPQWLSVRPNGSQRIEHVLEMRLYAGEPLVHVTHTLLNPSKAEHPGNTWPVLDVGTLPLPPVTWKMLGLHKVGKSQFQVDGRTHALHSAFRLTQGWPLASQRPDARAPLQPRMIPDAGVTLEGHSTGMGAEAIGLRLESSPTVRLDLDSGAWLASLDAYDVWTRQPARYELAADPVPTSQPPGRPSDPAYFLSLTRALPEGREVLQGGEQVTFRMVARLNPIDIHHPSHSGSTLQTQYSPLSSEGADMLLTPDSSTFLLLDAKDFLEARGAFRPDAPASEALLKGLEATRRSALLPQGRSPRSLSRTAYIHGAVGWREFGEVQADHETRCGVDAFEDAGFVSNYNNQYDLVGSAWHACGRSGNPAWCTLAIHLGRHTADVDVYHTRQDRPVWNGGLFWHTTHDTPAGDGTHRGWPSRTFSNGCTSWQAGGPGLGHLYLEGVLLGWLQLGELAQRDAAYRQGELALQRWTLDPTERDGRAVANTLRALLSLCEVTGLDVVCQAVDHVANTQPLPDPSTTQGARWMSVMQAEANLRWRDHLLVRTRIGLRPVPPTQQVKRVEAWLHALCTALVSSPDALSSVDVHALSAADVLQGCSMLTSVTPDEVQAFRQHAARLVAALEADYWARGTYSNAKELALLLSSGGRFRAAHGSTSPH